MIRICHVLKDGTRLEDVAGHLIKAEDHETLYQLINEIQKRKGNGEAHEGKD